MTDNNKIRIEGFGKNRYPIIKEDLFKPYSTDFKDVRSVGLPFHVNKEGETYLETLATSFENDVIALPNILWFEDNNVIVLHARKPLLCSKYCFYIDNTYGYEILGIAPEAIELPKRGYYTDHCYLWKLDFDYGVPLNPKQVSLIEHIIGKHEASLLDSEEYDPFLSGSFDHISGIETCIKQHFPDIDTKALEWPQIIYLLEQIEGKESIQTQTKPQTNNAAHEPQGSSQTRIDSKDWITIRDFIKTYCRESNTIDSKAATLHRYNQDKKIQLPQEKEGWKSGKSKFYRICDLAKIWPELQKTITLPDLKAAD